MPEQPLTLQIVVSGQDQIPNTLKRASDAVASGASTIINWFRQMGSASDEGAKKIDYSMSQASHSIRGIGEEIGIRMPRFVSTFLAEIPAVGAAMSAAFSAVAIIGFVQTLEQIPAAIAKAIDALHGWDDEARAL